MVKKLIAALLCIFLINGIVSCNDIENINKKTEYTLENPPCINTSATSNKIDDMDNKIKNVLLNYERAEKPIIFGTDWHTDCDDVVALRVLSWAHKQGIIKLLGISIDSVNNLSYASMMGFLEYEEIEKVSVGLDHGAYDYGGEAKYHKRLAELASKEYPNSECESSARMYRRLLAASDEKVDIIEVGFSQVLEQVLSSKADDISPLDGVELFEKKVNKLWIMGGNWKDLSSREFNFSKTQKASQSISTVLEICPVPITMLGSEIGEDVITGEIFRTEAIDDVLYSVLCDWGAANGRPSWDPMLVYLACVGDEKKAGYTLVHGIAHVDPVNGTTNFFEEKNGIHGYVVKNYANEEYAQYINEILLAGSKIYNQQSNPDRCH